MKVCMSAMSKIFAYQGTCLPAKLLLGACSMHGIMARRASIGAVFFFTSKPVVHPLSQHRVVMACEVGDVPVIVRVAMKQGMEVKLVTHHTHLLAPAATVVAAAPSRVYISREEVRPARVVTVCGGAGAVAPLVPEPRVACVLYRRAVCSHRDLHVPACAQQAAGGRHTGTYKERSPLHLHHLAHAGDAKCMAEQPALDRVPHSHYCCQQLVLDSLPLLYGCVVGNAELHTVREDRLQHAQHETALEVRSYCP